MGAGFAAARVVMHEVEHATPRGHRSDNPVGRTAAFVADVRAAKGDDFVSSWLSPRIAQFEDCVIWTIDFVRAHIVRHCGSLISEHRIVVREDQRAIEHFRTQTENLGEFRSGKKRRRKKARA